MKSIFVFALGVCLLAASGCDRGSRTRAAYDPAVERESYEDRIEGRLDEFELRFDGLEARMNGIDEETGNRLAQDIAELRDRKDAIERKFDDLERVSDESWLDLRMALDRELDDLEAAYNLVAANN